MNLQRLSDQVCDIKNELDRGMISLVKINAALSELQLDLSKLEQEIYNAQRPLGALPK